MVPGRCKYRFTPEECTFTPEANSKQNELLEVKQKKKLVYNDQEGETMKQGL